MRCRSLRVLSGRAPFICHYRLWAEPLPVIEDNLHVILPRCNICNAVLQRVLQVSSRAIFCVNSKIEWCHHTFNPWMGCQPVSPGCSLPKARGCSRADGATSSRIVLMLVKKPGNQLLQLELTGRVLHRSSVLKELPLDFSRKIIPLHVRD